MGKLFFKVVKICHSENDVIPSKNVIPNIPFPVLPEGRAKGRQSRPICELPKYLNTISIHIEASLK